MWKPIIYTIAITAIILLQVTILPLYISDPFKPNLLIIAVTWLALTTGRSGGFAAFMLGIIQDCFSGIYLGLNGFSYLSLFSVLNAASNHLYTESRTLMVFVVFLATLFNGFVHLLLLLIFSTANGIYASLLSDLIPQALSNAVISAILFSLPSLSAVKDSR